MNKMVIVIMTLIILFLAGGIRFYQIALEQSRADYMYLWKDCTHER